MIRVILKLVSDCCGSLAEVIRLQIRAPRLGGALGASLAVAALFAAPASSSSGVNWKETAKDGKVSVLSFHVTSLTIGTTGWSAHVSFGNLSKQTVKVGDQFGVAFFEDATSEDLSQAAALAPATTFSPARPTELKPGATWTGVISGTGTLAASRPSLYARVVFGPLSGVAGQTAPVYWITDHSKLLPPSGGGSSGVIPGGSGYVA
jgi:hypothetical protein